jgi:hypothetical protein
MVGEKKTRAMALVMEKRGFKTSLVERRFDETLRLQPNDPKIALFGVDNALARRALADPGFELIVEAGLGNGAKDFRGIRVHTFPGSKEPRALWQPAGEKTVNADGPAYDDLRLRGLDQCGVTLLAGKAVGAPFVGMTAAASCLSEVLRLLHGGEVFAVHDVDLKTPANRASIPRATPLLPFNPGFIPTT